MMSKTNWTPSQQNAIDARGMQILVSAAAGSGKTAVLTERVKNIVTDTENPCDVSDILVVTFTRAAAREMKERIHKALKDSYVKEHSDHIRDQISLLPLADICTIDSFCSKIVKDNFNKANVSVDFTLLDEKELSEMTSEAISRVIDLLYEENSEAFISLTSMFLSERDDVKLAEVIGELYKYSRSYPSPEIWLDSIADSFSPDKTPNETIWADIIYKDVGLLTDFHAKRLARTIALLEESGGFNPVFIERFTASRDKLLQLKKMVDDKNWNGMVNYIRDGLVVAPKAVNSKVDNYVKGIANDAFSAFKQDAEVLAGLDLPLEDEHRKDCALLRPMIEKLCQAVKMLGKELDSMKIERNAYSFDDILHKCIDLLVNFSGDTWTRTPIAENLQSKYKEIFIDEYQDTNHAQNIIFEALSRDCENLYCVGDVKQSIYKFRLASPELFMKLRRNLPEYNGNKQASQITLDRNFRSREGITQVTNHIFESVMSDAVGEIDYNEKERLVYGADYSKKDTPDVELLCLDYSEFNSAEATELEAEQIAEYIKKLLSSGIKIKTKQGERSLESSDICILLRSLKSKAAIYSEALKNVGIPSNTVLDGDVSQSKEIQFLVSLIKVVSNPLMDVPLVSVLFSPVFGFSADELAEIRMVDSKADLYVCLEKYAEQSPKARRFLDKIRLYRNISSSYPIDEFVRFVVKDTDVFNIYLASNEGVRRKANIRGFIDFAEKFTDSGRTGLGLFVRSLDNAINAGHMKSYNGNVSPEGVQIMSIHKSKGLEFPYVIVANCSAEFNRSDAYKTLKISRDTGIGLKIRDDKNFTTYNTVSAVATEKDILYSGASEELRVLYVAMTRAKEHITFVCSFKNRDGLKKKIRLNNYLSFNSQGKLHPYAVYKAKSMSELLLTCFSQHKDCDIVCDLCEIRIPENRVASYNMDVSPIVEYCCCVDDYENEKEAEVNYEVLNELKDRVLYEYKFDSSGLLAKRTASLIDNHKKDRRFFAKKKPQFLNESFTGADKGTAIHKFFELCDFRKAFINLDEEKHSLLNRGLMTEKELNVLDVSSVEAFLNSHIGQRLLGSQEVLKEYEFAFIKKAGELYYNVSDAIKDEEIVIQGKLDCAFIENDKAVLIDYKSDNVTDEDSYRNLYSSQLSLYAEALERCTGYKVEERYVYSFKLKRFIEI